MLTWMGISFFLSHQPKANFTPAQPSHIMAVSGTQWYTLPVIDWDTLISKSAHLVIFGLLAFLVWRIWQQPGTVLGITAAYAAIDECHQLFIPGRTARLLDVFIDCIGALLMVWWLSHQRKHTSPHAINSIYSPKTTDLPQ